MTNSSEHHGNQLMTTSWNGYAGNFGGINLCCLTKNQFAALAEIDEEELEAVPSKKVRFNIKGQEPHHTRIAPQAHEHGCHAATTKTHTNGSHKTTTARGNNVPRELTGSISCFKTHGRNDFSRELTGSISCFKTHGRHDFARELTGSISCCMTHGSNDTTKSTHSDSSNATKTTIHDNGSNDTTNRPQYTIGDAIEHAKVRAKYNLKVKNCQNMNCTGHPQVLDEDRAHDGGVREDLLCCLVSKSVGIQSLCMNVHDDEYEKVSVMIDSGASETVGSMEKFPSYPLETTTASGTTYSSAAEKQAEDIVNMGQKYVQVVDEYGVESWAKFQMCKGFGQ
jgi:hypothetical protein